MALKESEAIVLRTYPLRESDLLVTLFTRLEGKVKGVARAAKKSKRRFGGALEPMTYVRAVYDERERQELVRLDSCEVIESPMAGEVTFARATALAHVAELLDQLMPDREASDAVFRLTLAVLAELRGSGAVDAGYVLRAVDDAADGLFAGVRGVCGLRTGARMARGLIGMRWRMGWFAATIRGLRRRRCRRSRGRLRRRCCGRGLRNLPGLTGRRCWPRI